MFEIGFAELFLLGVIALLVVGPDRLPALARTVGVWVGRAQRLVGQVRADIEREVRADELRKAAKEYSPTGMLGDMRKEVEDFASEVSKPVDLDAEKTESAKSDTSDTAPTAPTSPPRATRPTRVPHRSRNRPSRKRRMRGETRTRPMLPGSPPRTHPPGRRPVRSPRRVRTALRAMPNRSWASRWRRNGRNRRRPSHPPRRRTRRSPERRRTGNPSPPSIPDRRRFRAPTMWTPPTAGWRWRRRRPR